ncbi:MAG TPA: hypothetical protein VFT36_08860 [Methylomirabilota bacterium]|nr:hypothetical protein [Methylomirabilota bacterium]
MRPIASLARRTLTFSLLGLALCPAAPGRAQTAPDVATEIARLRGRLAESGAQQQHCLAGAVQPVWTAALATDLQALQDRANQAAARGSAAEARRWKELARKAELLQAQVAESGRTGADLFRSQQIGLDCLDRHAEEREALRASLEVAVTDPALYAESLRLAREEGAMTLRRDLAALLEESRILSRRWKQDASASTPDAESLGSDLAAFRRRHTAALESAAMRTLADRALRAADALIAAASAWERQRAAGARVSRARDDAERRAAARERDEAGRLAREHWATAERLMDPGATRELATPGTTSPAAGGTP